MPLYSYRAVGSGAGATIEAPDRPSAVRELMRRGITPAAIEAMERGTAASAPGSFGATIEAMGEREGGGASRADAPAGANAGLREEGGMRAGGRGRAMARGEVASFVRELSTAIMAGLPLVPALRTIAKQGRGEAQRAMLARMIDEVEHGRPLSEAMQRQGRTFHELIVNMVTAGEASGKLGEVLRQAADLLDKDVKLRRQIQAATLYPLILLVLIGMAITVVVTVIVPRILGSVKGQLVVLPWPTRVVQGLAHAVGSYWWLIAALMAGAVWLGGRVYSQPSSRQAIDRALLSVPILGRLLRDVAVARFTRTLGTLTSAGVPVLQSLRITKGTLGNVAMEGVVDRVIEQVAAGRTIADPMEQSGYFPPMLVQIVNLGERSGRLEELLDQAAGAFEDKTEQSVKLFTTALPPVLVVMLACVVGFVVLAILLPLLSVQEAAFR